MNQIIIASLQGSAFASALTPDKDRINSRLHIVADAMGAGTFEEGERPIARVEHPLLRLARIGTDEQHPAAAHPHMRHVHRHARVVDQRGSRGASRTDTARRARSSAEHGPSDRTTTFRDARSSRQIALIGLPCTKYSVGFLRPSPPPAS
jgi:hypothetical protein